ncbi:MAG: hypothetical protein JO057_31205 [Chloroflexi bacterium]|nr:hypothetical protein [Chloroflexota bacterium]
MLEPSEAEIDEWAAQERRRREAWLKGPTEAQKAAWAESERARRLGAGRGPNTGHRPMTPSPVVVQRLLREAELATKGAISLLFQLSIGQAFDQLVRAGREWEEEFSPAAERPRSVAPPRADLSDDADGDTNGPTVTPERRG